MRPDCFQCGLPGQNAVTAWEWGSRAALPDDYAAYRSSACLQDGASNLPAVPLKNGHFFRFLQHPQSNEAAEHHQDHPKRPCAEPLEIRRSPIHSTGGKFGRTSAKVTVSLASPVLSQALMRAGRQQSQRLPNRLYAIRFMTGVLDQVT